MVPEKGYFARRKLCRLTVTDDFNTTDCTSSHFYVKVRTVYCSLEEKQMEIASSEAAEILDLDVPQKIDTINKTEVCARVIAGPDVQFGRRGKVSVLHMEVVAASGNYFTLEDLKKMSLRRDEIYQFEELCRRRRGHIGALYFPRVSADDIDIRPGVHFIDPEKGVRVTFFLTKLLPYD